MFFLFPSETLPLPWPPSPMGLADQLSIALGRIQTTCSKSPSTRSQSDLNSTQDTLNKNANDLLLLKYSKIYQTLPTSVFSRINIMWWIKTDVVKLCYISSPRIYWTINWVSPFLSPRVINWRHWTGNGITHHDVPNSEFHSTLSAETDTRKTTEARKICPS